MHQTSLGDARFWILCSSKFQAFFWTWPYHGPRAPQTPSNFHWFGNFNYRFHRPHSEENVFAFDVYDPELRRLVLEVFQRHGLALDPVNPVDPARGRGLRPRQLLQLLAPRICGQLRRGEGEDGDGDGMGWPGWLVILGASAVLQTGSKLRGLEYVGMIPLGEVLGWKSQTSRPDCATWGAHGSLHEFTCVENPKKEIHHVWRLDYVGLHWQPLRVWFNCWAVQTKYWCKTNSDVHSSPDDLAAKLRAPRKCIVSDSFRSSTWPVHDWCPISLRRLFKSAPFSVFWCLDSNRFA